VAIPLLSIFPLPTHASSLLWLDGTDCLFTYPGVGDAIWLTKVSEINASDRFCTFEAHTADENAVGKQRRARADCQSDGKQYLLFDVRWDGTSGTILIDTAQDYSMQYVRTIQRFWREVR